MKHLVKLALVAVFAFPAFGGFSATSNPAKAQAYSQMSCQQLWFARNEIYARNGHCFKTRRGIRTFGRNCFPPYGRLARWERRKVQRIISWEHRLGCR